jgi:hypothetical protein
MKGFRSIAARDTGHATGRRAFGPGLRAVAILLLPAAAGCGSGQPPLHPVTGRVLFDGRPATGFAVAFSSSAEATKGVEATGRIDADGRFALETRQDGQQRPGAVAGPHRVVILPPPGFGDDSGEIEAIPLRYADYSQSGLTAEVRPDAPNEILLELVP